MLVAGHPGRVRTWADRAVSGLTPWDPIAKVVMLDAGMAFSLSKSEQQEIVNFFQACIDLDGYRAGQAGELSLLLPGRAI